MQLSRIFKVLILICFFFSCKNETNKSDINATKEENKKEVDLRKSPLDVDFLGDKYNKGYHLIIDESNVSEHPQFSFLDCDNEGYFTVHFLPKNNNLMGFWKNYYKNFDDADSVKDINTISGKVNQNLNDYSIFCCQISKDKLDKKNGCTIESVSALKEATTDVYMYNQSEQKWDLLKQVKSSLLPPYLDNNFFATNFPDVFKGISTSESDDDKKDSQLCQLSKLSENFNFNVTSVAEIINDNESTNVSIQITDKKNNLLQEIKYAPQFIMLQDKPFCNAISYFNSSKKIEEGLEEYHSFIVMDFNFDGLEDFAILNYEGSNSGPQYAYFLQDKNMKFQKNTFLTESIRIFPVAFDVKNKTFTQTNPVGCCKINTTVYELVSNNKWKVKSSKQQDME